MNQLKDKVKYLFEQGYNTLRLVIKNDDDSIEYKYIKSYDQLLTQIRFCKAMDCDIINVEKVM